MTEFRGISITDEQQEFLKNNNINLSHFVRKAIDHAMCKHIVTLRPDLQEWIESNHLNLSVLLNEAIDNEMKNNGR